MALVGPSGAGKSSVIALLEHFYETNDGRIMVDGVEIQQYKHKYYHQMVKRYESICFTFGFLDFIGFSGACAVFGKYSLQYFVRL